MRSKIDKIAITSSMLVASAYLGFVSFVSATGYTPVAAGLNALFAAATWAFVLLPFFRWMFRRFIQDLA
ncbi:MAG: hypothetical protein R2706_11455 [Acidimicrobiales bacterium]